MKKLIIPILCIIAGVIIASFISPGTDDQRFIDEIEAREAEIEELESQEKKLLEKIETSQAVIDELKKDLSGAIEIHEEKQNVINWLYSQALAKRAEEKESQSDKDKFDLMEKMDLEIKSLTAKLGKSLDLNHKYELHIGLMDERLELCESRFELMEKNFHTQEMISKMWKKKADKKWPYFVGGALAATITFLFVRALASK